MEPWCRTRRHQEEIGREFRTREVMQQTLETERQGRAEAESRCGTSQHGLPSNAMALITSDCGAMRPLGRSAELSASLAETMAMLQDSTGKPTAAVGIIHGNCICKPYLTSTVVPRS